MRVSQPQNPVQMAVVGAPHGVQGELRVKTFTGDPEAIGDYGPLFGPDGRMFEISKARLAKDIVVVRFAGISDRDAAARLTGTPLFVDRSALPDDLDEEEFYHADLIGLGARDRAGNAIGSIVAVHDFGGGDVLEMKLADGRLAMMPFTQAAVPAIDIAAGVVTVDPLAAGLLDEEELLTGGEGEAAFDAGDRPRGPRSAGGNR